MSTVTERWESGGGEGWVERQDGEIGFGLLNLKSQQKVHMEMFDVRESLSKDDMRSKRRISQLCPQGLGKKKTMIEEDGRGSQWT